MKKINNLLFAFLLVGLWQTSTSAQIACNSLLQVSLAQDGTATVFLDALLDGTIDPAATFNIELKDDDTQEIISQGSQFITMSCDDIDRTMSYAVTNLTTEDTCWGSLTLEDKSKPTPYCISGITVSTLNGMVELYAEDFDQGSFDNCTITATTFGQFAFDFEEEVINGVTINSGIPHLFDENGPIAAVITATVDQIADYDNGLSQLWDPGTQTSSMMFSSSTTTLQNVYISYTDQSANYDYCFTSLTLIGDETSSQGDCLDNIDAAVGLWDCSIDDLSPADFISPGLAYENGQISKDGIAYADVLVNPSFGSAGSHPLYIKYTSGGENYNCTVQVTVIDEIDPIAIAENEVHLLLTPDASNAYTATLLTETVDNGSYDNCSAVTLALSQTLFTEVDLGENTVTMTVTDASGNSNDVFTTVIVSIADCDSPLSDLVQWPLSNIYIDNPDQDGLETTPQVLIDDYGFTEAEVMPTVDSTVCDAVFLGYNDQVFILSTGWKLIRTWNAINWISSEVIEFSQVINNSPFNEALSCISQTTVLVEAGTSVQMYAEDLLLGYSGNVTELTLVITDPDGNIVPDNMITSSYEGIPLTYTVTNTITNNSCFGTLTVVIGSGSSCTFDPVEDINWPLEMLSISDDTVDAQDLTPEALVDSYGFLLSEVEVSINDTDCEVGSVYEDTVIELGGTGSSYFKILRTWTVIEWNSADVFVFVQVINNTVDPSTYICDTLSRLTPIGDCDSGHTDTDDVEWPEDVVVSDHRITPIQLETISNIDPLDAQPSFYNEASLYSASYIDILSQLTSTQIFLDRNWTVTRDDGNGLSWTYTQSLTVNFEDFENLVTVNTPTGYALPGVEINNTFSTSTAGSLLLVDQEVENLYKFDTFKSGVNIRDIVLMRQAILGQITLNESQLIAGDFNRDGMLSALDIVLARRILNGSVADPGVEWIFIDETNTIASGLRPKASYVGIKSCDIDDSFGASQTILQEEDELAFTDILLNAGESYEVDVFLNTDVVMRGADLSYLLTSDALEIIGIETNVDMDVTWHRNEDGILSILMAVTEEGAIHVGGTDEPMLTILVESKANGILSEQLQFATSIPSVYINTAYDQVALGGSVEGVILDVFDDPTNALSFVSVYPNPATELVTFDLPSSVAGQTTITLMDAGGRVVAETKGQNTLDVSHLSSGMYVYRIASGVHIFHQKLAIHRP